MDDYSAESRDAAVEQAGEIHDYTVAYHSRGDGHILLVYGCMESETKEEDELDCVPSKSFCESTACSGHRWEQGILHLMGLPYL